MKALELLYHDSLALLTDLYQLTMAYGYWKENKLDQEAVFHLTFRRNPFRGGYCVACGLGLVEEYLSRFRFSPDDIHYLATLIGGDGKPLFEPAFLQYLGDLHLQCDVDAVPEGTIVFPHEPLIRVTGPILQCQILETPLLNLMGFQSLVATKASRICMAAQGDPVIEFGLRRAQGIDGALSASRAAFVGGCSATSNLLAGKILGIPVRGTHAHSWVMSFDEEMEAFQAYARAMPNNCVFLVDTYDSIEGVRRAIEAGRWLEANGHRMLGIRLDSGDLAYLSIQARKMLDEAGFSDAVIIASNDLDEAIITSLKLQGAAIAVWGVGTKLVTSDGDPALAAVYKLSAIRLRNNPWRFPIKLSEQILKITTPGILQVRRFYEGDQALADMIYSVHDAISEPWRIIDPADSTRRRMIPASARYQDLLEPIFRVGGLVRETPALEESRHRLQTQLRQFHSGMRRLINPHEYPVGFEKTLHEMKTQLIMEARGMRNNAHPSGKSKDL